MPAPLFFSKMILTPRYFVHPQTRIAGIDTTSAGRPSLASERILNDVLGYIKIYEPKFLIQLFGTEDAAEIEKRPDILRMLANPDEGTSVIAKYVYFYYARDHITFNTMAGDKILNGDDSRTVSGQMRLVNLWNEMVDECFAIIKTAGDSITPDWQGDIFYKINIFNL